MRIDMKNTLSSRLRGAALAVMLAASGMASAALLHVQVDTKALGASSGYLDMNLSTYANVPLATVLVSNMVGFDPLADIDAYGVTSSNGGYLFRNDTMNDLFHAVSFGGALSFDLTFGGEIDPFATYLSHFVIAAYDDAFAPLGNYDPANGALAGFTWTASPAPGVDGSIRLSLPDARVGIVPEPADMLLMGTGLAAMALALRRRARPGRLFQQSVN